MDDGDADHVDHVRSGEDQPWDQTRAEQGPDRHAHLIPEHDQHDAGRDDLPQRAGGGNDPDREFVLVAVPHHDRERDQPHRGHGRTDHAGRRGHQRSHADHADSQPTPEAAEQNTDRLQKVLGQVGLLQNRAHEDEKGDGQERLVRHDSKRAVRKRSQENEIEVTDPTAQHGEDQGGAGKRESDRIPGEDEGERPQKHDRTPDCSHEKAGFLGGLGRRTRVLIRVAGDGVERSDDHHDRGEPLDGRADPVIEPVDRGRESPERPHGLDLMA